MNMTGGCSHWKNEDREKNEEMLCLFALGELTVEENARVEEHLGKCEFCRDHAKELEKMMLFDLPAVAVMRSGPKAPEESAAVDGHELLANIRIKIHESNERRRTEDVVAEELKINTSVPIRTRTLSVVKGVALVAGWAIAAVLVLFYFQLKPAKPRLDQLQLAQVVTQDNVTAESLRARLSSEESKANELKSELSSSTELFHGAQLAYSQMNSRYQNLNAAYSALEQQLKQEESKLSETSGELELTRRSLTDQESAKESLQAQLSDVRQRLEKQSSEIARLDRVAKTVPVNFPVPEEAIGGSEAKEILGARDLHIVDVYDVDDSGKSSRSYGRIYYVNHTQLIFYAFDLSQLQKKSRKLMAFQAWGFRQPKASAVESLGLFYMDNEKLNRWTLRVSDPQLLSRIDTLFVTLEPPGGSPTPRGKRLLMASLTGPANHP